MKQLRGSSLTLLFLVLTLMALAAQAVAGLALEREELASHGQPSVSLVDYVTSSSYGADVLENWQSEFLQFWLFIVATVWLVQRGSAETKQPGDEGHDDPSPRGMAATVRAHGLVVVMFALFALTWFGQAVTGWRTFNEEESWHDSPAVDLSDYVREPDFWARSLQNWQSEFLAIAAMAVFTVYLRERGSPESKRLDTPDAENDPTY